MTMAIGLPQQIRYLLRWVAKGAMVGVTAT